MTVVIIIVVLVIVVGYLCFMVEISPLELIKRLIDLTREIILIFFLEKREKKNFFSQLSFLKKKLKKESWRGMFYECLMDCRMEDIGEEYYGELYGDDKHLRPSFREFWSISSNSSFFSEKEREWIEEIEREVEERIKERKKSC